MNEKSANTAIRAGIAGVFLWFGVSQLLDPAGWTSWVPLWMDALPIATETLILIHGAFETLFGLALLTGFQTRIAAAGLFASLLFTTIHLNYGPTMIRDLGLLIVTIALVFQKNAYTYRDLKR
jgi:putative oxidoreductase